MAFQGPRRVREWLRLLFAVSSTLLSGPHAPRASAATLPDPALLTGIALGGAPTTGSVASADGLIRLEAQGAGLGGRADQGYFAYAAIGTNDVDVQVRVHSMDTTVLSARAGLMVRDSTNNGAPAIAVLATPGMSGIQFLARTSPEGPASLNGAFPAVPPDAWLRLLRSNDVWTGFASPDGRRWTQVGRATVAFTNALLGLAASSARTNAPATALLSDWADATGESEDPLPPIVEPPGPSSRRTPLAITEIHYNPPGRPQEGELPLAFIEVFNSDFTARSLAGHRLEAGTVRFVFPTNITLPPGGYLVVAQDPETLRTRHPNLPPDRILGPWEGALDRSSDTVQLWSAFGALLLEVPYTDRPPWPLAADGEGHTLVLTRPSWGESDPRAWASSSAIGGSPGSRDPATDDPRSNLRITEVFQPGGTGAGAFVEVFNSGIDPAPLAGLRLQGPADTGDPSLELPDSMLPPGGRITVEAPANLGPLPSPLLLRIHSGGRVLDAVAFHGPAARTPLGRDAAGAGEPGCRGTPPPDRAHSGPAERRSPAPKAGDQRGHVQTRHRPGRRSVP